MGKTRVRAKPKPSPTVPRVPFPADFWQAPTLEELAEAQGVKPVTDFESLLGGWPKDEINDGFEEALLAMRRANPVKRR